MKPWLLLLSVLAGLYLLHASPAEAAAQCPLCGMIASEEVFFEWKYGQKTYFCNMGHSPDAINDPSGWLEAVATSAPEELGTEVVACPVCGMEVDTSDPSSPRVAVKNGQSVWTCSSGHAHDVFNNPTAYASSSDGGSDEEEEETVLCHGGTVMFDGFTLTGSGTCARYLFKGWDLNTTGKLFGAIIGTVLMGVLLEGTLQYRRLLIENGVTTWPFTRGSDVTQESEPLNSSGTKRPAEQTWWTHLLSTLLLAIALTLGYFLMLIAMLYYVPLLLATVAGLTIGQSIFRASTFSRGLGEKEGNACC